MNDTWLISDTHFFHRNIGRYCGRPPGWQELLLKNWNKYVQPEDQVLHLGDFALGRKADIRELAGALNGEIYLMLGNHDRHSKSFYEGLGFILVPDPYYVDGLMFSHRPVIPLTDGLYNLHGHTHNQLNFFLGARHINLSVEMRDYRPWQLREILEKEIGLA